MTHPKIFGIVLAAAALVACATQTTKQYGAMERGATTVATTNLEAINNTTVMKLMSGAEVETSIQSHDSQMQLAGLMSNYKVFEIQLDAPAKYKLDLKSLCSCVGFDKTILNPKTFVLDSHGESISEKPTFTGYGSPGWTRPGSVHVVWEGTINEPGKYYFLVTADNQLVGKSASEVIDFPASAPGIELLSPVRISPFGDIIVSYSRN